MTYIFHHLSAVEINRLHDALKSERLRPPYTTVGVQRYYGGPRLEELTETLRHLDDTGASPAALALMLKPLAQAKEEAEGTTRVELVWTGPDTPETPSRDTGPVIRQLFRSAQSHILLAGYAIFQGKEVFRALAERMEEYPALQVQLFIDIKRRFTDTSLSYYLSRGCVENFKKKHWPCKRMPELYYYPPSLEMNRKKKAALHAKCVVVDEQVAFVSSANFTEAAQIRNIEAGALIHSPAFARQLVSHFQTLAARNLLPRVTL